MRRHLFFGICLLTAAVAHATNIQVDFASASLTGAPGGTLAFFASLTNTSPTDTIYLNGAGFTSVSSFLTIDITPFLINAPLFLDPGQTSTLFEILDVTLDPATPLGPYAGNTLSLTGGADGGNGTASLDLADPTFDVIASSESAVPEPRTGALVAMGIGVFVLAAWRRASTVRPRG
jgi:hypothetical protein